MTEHQQDQPEDLTTPEIPAGDDQAPAEVPELPDAPPMELVTISWRNIEFTIPKCRLDWDMNVQFEFEEGNRLRGMMTLLGGGPAGRYAVRQKLYAGGCRTAGDLDDFFKHAGNIAEKECTDKHDEDSGAK